MPAAARLGDYHKCPSFTGPIPHVGGGILPGCSTDIEIDFKPAARTLDKASCFASAPDVLAMGCPTVIMNNQLAVRVGDLTAHGGEIKIGSGTVEIGMAGDGVAISPIEFIPLTISTAASNVHVPEALPPVDTLKPVPDIQSSPVGGISSDTTSQSQEDPGTPQCKDGAPDQAIATPTTQSTLTSDSTKSADSDSDEGLEDRALNGIMKWIGAPSADFTRDTSQSDQLIGLFKSAGRAIVASPAILVVTAWGELTNAPKTAGTLIKSEKDASDGI